jgi:hypothetical protein
LFIGSARLMDHIGYGDFVSPGRVAMATTDVALAESITDLEPTAVVRRCDSVTDAVVAALDSAASGLGQYDRGRAALVFAAPQYCAEAVAHFTVRCEDTARRLRPSDSTRLETSELVRAFASRKAWPGSTFVLTDPGAYEALNERALALLRSSYTAVLRAELLLHGSPFRDPDAAALVTAVLLRRSVRGTFRPAFARVTNGRDGGSGEHRQAASQWRGAMAKGAMQRLASL